MLENSAKVSSIVKYKGEISNVIYKTDDLSMFNLSKHNRNVVLTKDMLKQCEEGFLNPILVNENFTVIDGQHRLEASKQLGKTVEYVIKAGLRREDIVRMNTVQRKWSIESFIESFANAGESEYIRLTELIKKNYTNSGAVVRVALNSSSEGKASDIIQSGKFKFHNYNKAIEFLNYYKRFKEELNVPNKSKNATAIYEMFRLKGFDGDRLIQKVMQTNVRDEIRAKTHGHIDALKLFIDTYNQGFRKNSKSRIEYHITSMGTFIVDSEKQNWAKSEYE